MNERKAESIRNVPRGDTLLKKKKNERQLSRSRERERMCFKITHTHQKKKSPVNGNRHRAPSETTQNQSTPPPLRVRVILDQRGENSIKRLTNQWNLRRCKLQKKSPFRTVQTNCKKSYHDVGTDKGQRNNNQKQSKASSSFIQGKQASSSTEVLTYND